MEKNGYKKIPTDEDAEKVSFFSCLFFQWMNSVFKTGNERALEENDFLPLEKENTSCFLIEKLQSKWNEEQTKCSKNGKKPKLWKSVLKMLSLRETMVLFSLGGLTTLCRILQPLFLGYLLVSLMTTKPHHNYLLYGCALAMGINAFIRSLCVHQFDYRCELLGIRISSAVKGLVYHKVCTIQVLPISAC